MAGEFKIQRYISTTTILAAGTNANDQNVPGNGLGGIIRAIKVNAPAGMTGTLLTLSILDDSGDTIFSQASIPVNAKTMITKDGANNNLFIPIAIKPGVPLVNILSNGTEASNATIVVDLYIERS